MPNLTTSRQSQVTLTEAGHSTTVDLYSRAGLEFLSNLWIKAAAEFRLMYEPTWLGRPIIQFPTDIVAIQELLWQVQPEVVVETGVAHGGSLLLSASILELLGRGRVIGVDLDIRPPNRAALAAHPLWPRLHLIEGSSTAPEVFAQVRAQCAGAHSVLVFLDSNHTAAHVGRELELYHTLVTPGSYLVAHDGAQAWVSDIPSGKPEWGQDHPLAAIHTFLAAHPEFQAEAHWTRWLITSSPDGFLRRRTDQELRSA